MRRSFTAAVAHQTRHFAGAPTEQRLNDVHADKTIGAGYDDFMHIAHVADRQWLDFQCTLGVGHGLGAEYGAVIGAAYQRCQFDDGRQFDEAVDRNATPELLTQTQQHAREQNRVATKIEEAFVSGNVAARQLQQLRPDLQQQRFIGIHRQAFRPVVLHAHWQFQQCFAIDFAVAGERHARQLGPRHRLHVVRQKLSGVGFQRVACGVRLRLCEERENAPLTVDHHRHLPVQLALAQAALDLFRLDPEATDFT